MKRIIGISLIVACSLLFATSSIAAEFEKKPGLYVHHWPIFSLSYPTEWEEKTPPPGLVFRAEGSKGVPTLQINVFVNSNSLPINMAANLVIPVLSRVGTNVRVIDNKGSKLDDGTKIQETVIEWVYSSGAKLNTLLTTAAKGKIWIMVFISDTKEISEDLRKVAYSLKIKPGKEELVKLTPDIKEFIDQYNKDQLSHDIKKLMSHYSDKFLSNGTNKAQVEAFTNSWLAFITSSKWGITVFEPKGEKAYLAGYAINNFGTYPIELMLMKENGQWKIHGNQKKSQEWVISE
jgi:protein associated with RNAse G/E